MARIELVLEILNSISGTEVFAQTTSQTVKDVGDFDEEKRTLKVETKADTQPGTYDFTFHLQYNKKPSREKVYNCKLTIVKDETPAEEQKPKLNEKGAI